MLRRSLLRLGAALAVIVLGCGFILLPHGGGIGASTAVQLTRTFNNPTGTATSTNQFWIIGQPFISGPTEASAGIVSQTPDVPSGNIFTATLGGTSVRVAACQRKTDSDDSLAWAQTIVDMTGANIAGGGSATLQLTSTPGSWSSSTNATDADWQAMNLNVVISPVTTTSASNPDMDSGPYTASFNSSASIATVCNSPLGREVMVVANFVNGSSVAHCYLQARVWFWVTQNSSGDAGETNSPIAWKGPRIENEQGFKSGSNGCDSGDEPGIFGYTVTLKLGSTTIRTYSGLQQQALTGFTLDRPNGWWDWYYNGNVDGNIAPIYADAGLYVTQDPTKVAATYKVPALEHGVSYTGSNASDQNSGFPTVSVASAASDTFTVSSNVFGLLQDNNDVNAGNRGCSPVAVSLVGTSGSGLSGPSDGTTYWATESSTNCGNASQFILFDNLTDAYNYAVSATTTGQITFTGTCSGGCGGLYARIDAAPGSTGVYNLYQPSDGNWPDLSLFSEWGMAYLFAATTSNPEAYQRWARVQAEEYATQPINLINNATGTIPSMLDAADTPSSLPNMAGGTGLGTANPTLQYTSFWSTDLNGPGGPTSSCTGFGPQLLCQGGLFNIDTAHVPGNPGFVVWLLEGDPELQWTGMQMGNMPIGAFDYGLTLRNFSDPDITTPAPPAGGTTYYGVCPASLTSGTRVMAWCWRNMLQADFMATGGSAEEKYFDNMIANNMAWVEADQSWTDGGSVGNYTKLGLYTFQQTYPYLPLSTVFENGPWGSNFMSSYGGVALGFGAMLDGNAVSSLNTVANREIGLFLDEWNAATCPYFADAYYPLFTASDSGATPPAAYVTSGEVGVGNGGTATTGFMFNGSTVTTGNAGWQPGNPSDDTTPYPFAVGDGFRPANTFLWNDAINSGATTPSQITDGTNYTILNPSGATFQLNNGSGGAISFSGPGTQMSVSSATWSGNSLTVNTASANGVVYEVNGDSPGYVKTAGFTPSTLNGTFPVSAVNSTTQFVLNIGASGTLSSFSGATEAPLVGGVMIPSGQPCTGNQAIHMFFSSVTDPYGYLVLERAALAIGAERGVTGIGSGQGTALTAYTAAAGRYTGNFNTYASWAFQGAP